MLLMIIIARSESLFSSLLSKNLLIILVLLRNETCSLTIRKARRRRMLKNIALKKIEPKRDEIMESWRKLHNSFIEVRDWKGEARYLSEVLFLSKVCGARCKKIVS